MKQTSIDSIEQGRVKRPRKFRELAMALKTSEEWLLWEEGPEHVEPNHQPQIVKTPEWLEAAILHEIDGQQTHALLKRLRLLGEAVGVFRRGFTDNNAVTPTRFMTPEEAQAALEELEQIKRQLQIVTSKVA